MSVRSTQDRSPQIKATALVGVFLALAGVVLLFYPVSVSSYGLTAACGNTITRDNSEPSRLYARFDTDLAEDLGIPTPLDLDTAPSTKCTDALTFRRWIAWPAVFLGVTVAFLGLRKLPWSNLVNAVNASSKTATPTKKSSAPATPQRDTTDPDPTNHAPLPTAPAGWYPDPHQPRGLRWFDGSQWTAGTAPDAQTRTSPEKNESDSR
ncbi:DUF2510 domain-containing protein [Rhodococcoides fascians]|uniref:DUF2510 domain-containing protein n=1 Tax=Rhodococcoides fascians TaxID=1828 RepID=UPI003526B3BD